MRKMIFAASVSMVALAFMSDSCETVTVKGEDGSPLRINKADFDADPGKWKVHKDEQEQATPGQITLPDPETQQPLAAPSAPHFGGGEGDPSAPAVLIDPLKGAVAPSAPSPNQRLVAKETVGTGKNKGDRYFVVDGSGVRLEMDGVEADGYETEAAAWKAIMELPH